MMEVLILANGEPPTAERAQELAAQYALVIATDGAAHRAAELGITPHIICGDFDSILLKEASEQFPATEFIPMPDQNLADLEKAIVAARQQGATRIHILGASGGRMDHTFANYALLLRYQQPTGLDLLIEAEGAITRAVRGLEALPGLCEFETQPGDTVSVISFEGAASVSLSGVQWPLEDYYLSIGTQGVSNVALGERVTVRVSGGAVLVFHLPARREAAPSASLALPESVSA